MAKTGPLLLGLLVAATITAVAPDARAQFTMRSLDDEKRIGAENHPKILQEYGGAYAEPNIGAYFAEIAGRLAANSDNPQIGYTFTVLNSPVLNAFALPGGYVYITRMIVALANDEAEVAGVIGHEIGHVTARHGSQRETQGLFGGLVGIGAAVLGAAVGIPELGQVAQIGAAAYLGKYSRDQEYEADQLGIRVLSRVGYDPYGMADFLESLGAYTEFEAKKLGKKREVSIFDSHPNTPERVTRAIQEAGFFQNAQRVRNNETYLRRIDGMLYGDDPREGLIKGRVFYHPALRIAFQVPEGFSLINQSEAVIAIGPNSAAIRFDVERDKRRAANDPSSYISRVWTNDGQTRQVERININGFDAATGVRRARAKDGSPVDARLVAIRAGDQLYRFLYLSDPNDSARLADGFYRTTYSFRGLSEAEAASIHPQIIRVMRAGPNESEQSMAARMPNDGYQLEHFRILNGLDGRQQFRPGRLYKIVAEQ